MPCSQVTGSGGVAVSGSHHSVPCVHYTAGGGEALAGSQDHRTPHHVATGID